MQNAAFQRGFDHVKAQTACPAGDSACARAKEMIESKMQNIPKARTEIERVRDSGSEQ